MRKLLYLFLIIGLLCFPVMGATLPFYVDKATDHGFYSVSSLSYNSVSEGEAIGVVYFDVNLDTVLNFVLYFHDGSTKMGIIEYKPESFTEYTMTLTLDGSSDSLTGYHIPYSYATVQLGYWVENETTFKMGITNKNLEIFVVDPQVYINIDDPASNPLIQIDITSDGNIFDSKIQTATIESISTAKIQHASGGDDIVAFVQSTISGVLQIFFTIWGIFKFFFVDNLGLIIILLEGGILAYRFSTSSDIFIALSRVISDNERLLRGLISFIESLANAAWGLINPFK